jgi:hypothetical protein
MAATDDPTGLVPAFHGDLGDHDPIQLVSTTHRYGDVTIYDPDYEAGDDEWLTSSIAVRLEDAA